MALSHLDDELFDGAGVTKRHLLDHLDALSAQVLVGLADRPLSVVRVRPGSAPFMQKNLPTYAPDWIRRSTTWSGASKREVSYAVVEDRRGWSGSPTSGPWSSTSRSCASRTLTTSTSS